MPIQMTLLSELLPLAGRAVPTCLETGRKILYSMCICINAATTAIPEGVGHANCKTPMEERTKTLQVAKTFLKHRKENLERILSDDGILFRTNRSIQAEGSFGDLKQDMQFRRYLSKGVSNVLAESTLLAMARNINKLHNKIQKGRTGTHLFSLGST